MTGKEFAQWMEAVGISLTEAADLFGVSEATLYNWRSTVGVPERKLGWVRGRMTDYDKQTRDLDVSEPRETRPGFYEIFRSDEELHRSDRASRLAGAESLAAWCHDVILAETNRALAAEKTGSSPDPDPLSSVPPDPLDAGTASPGSSSPGAAESEVA